jgi:hypothetical protein
MLVVPDGRVALPKRPRPGWRRRGLHAMEFCRGPAEVAAAIREGRRSSLPNDYCLHNNEVVLAIHHAMGQPGYFPITTRFEPLSPMPWA